MEKVQSVRRVQGPVQRMLGLATIHLDTAGRRIQAELTDRDVDEVDRQLAVLPGQCRAARHGQRPPRSTDTGFVDQVTQALDAS
ncbi:MULTISPECIES: PH domain-containing protein [unclassified Frankia]|uniref:PH domain-containing protein n=1 Tax=unclassified Frankia TaxID=2632575 RepID=UPI002AD34CD9|nr:MULTISPECIES: PH domain-containing protein [unclassified Frankia]